MPRLRWWLFALIGVLFAAAMAGCEEIPQACACNETVQIVTPPLQQAHPLYVDFNDNGLNEEEELLGEFPLYDWNREITVTWQADPYEQLDPAHTSYRVSLYQIDFSALEEAFAAAFEGGAPDALELAREVKVAHHWATNPNGRRFTFGSFGFGEDICLNCPTMVLVAPETYRQVYNPATGVYEYEYTLIPIEEGLYQSSSLFVFHSTPR